MDENKRGSIKFKELKKSRLETIGNFIKYNIKDFEEWNVEDSKYKNL
jgi:hypothetical protein